VVSSLNPLPRAIKKRGGVKPKTSDYETYRDFAQAYLKWAKVPADG
jgi:hypothetical protein